MRNNPVKRKYRKKNSGISISKIVSMFVCFIIAIISFVVVGAKKEYNYNTMGEVISIEEVKTNDGWLGYIPTIEFEVNNQTKEMISEKTYSDLYNIQIGDQVEISYIEKDGSDYIIQKIYSQTIDGLFKHPIALFIGIIASIFALTALFSIVKFLIKFTFIKIFFR